MQHPGGKDLLRVMSHLSAWRNVADHTETGGCNNHKL